LPKRVALARNYPNRFHYALPNGVDVKPEVCDVLGCGAALLTESIKQAGWYRTIFCAEDLSNGMHLCRLQAGMFAREDKRGLLK